MKKRGILFFVVFILVVNLFALEPAVRFVEPLRRITSKPAVSYGPTIVIENRTGYTLTHIDLFTYDMAMKEKTFHNLLEGDPLVHDSFREITLENVPLLNKELRKKDSTLFILNAIDDSGDSYYKLFDPQRDGWNIILSLDDYDQYYDYASDYVPSEKELVIANETFFPFTELYITDNALYEQEMLQGSTFYSGSALIIDTEAFPDLFNPPRELAIYLVDSDGDYVYTPYNPSTDGQFVTFFFDDLYGDEYASIEITNTSGLDIWYLYLVTKEMYVNGDTGEDLLDYYIFYSQETLTLYPFEVDYLYEALYGDEDLYFIFVDIEGNSYTQKWNPLYDEWRIDLFPPLDDISHFSKEELYQLLEQYLIGM
jgi:hypothetical protein